MTIELPTPDATRALGRRLAEGLFPGSMIALDGPLGAGKTQLVRAIAEGLGVADPSVVASPTFALIHEYVGRLPIYHFDAYRLRGPEDFLDLGAHEYLEGNGVCLVEWAERVESALPLERLEIELEITGADQRRAKLQSVGNRHETILNRITRAMECR